MREKKKNASLDKEFSYLDNWIDIAIGKKLGFYSLRKNGKEECFDVNTHIYIDMLLPLANLLYC